MTSPARQKKGAFALQPSLARLVAAKRFLARIVLFAEQILPLLMPAVCVIAIYLSISWFGLFRIVPDWLRIFLLIAFAAGFLASLLPLRNLRWPRVTEADRMLEIGRAHV